ncbi:MAG TPA: hypothetical protein VGD27_10085 [Longimicrobiales bacterium]
MDAHELLALNRPLTPAEMAVVEDELLHLAQELQKEVDRISESVADEHAEEIARLKRAAAATLENIEAAIAVPLVPVAPGEPRRA